jgi:hypothetical protein
MRDSLNQFIEKSLKQGITLQDESRPFSHTKKRVFKENEPKNNKKTSFKKRRSNHK